MQKGTGKSTRSGALTRFLTYISHKSLKTKDLSSCNNVRYCINSDISAFSAGKPASPDAF